MIAVKLLPILQVLVILCSSSPTQAYPSGMYGTKRYGRLQRSYQASPLIRTQRYPMNYYEMYPYSQTYPEEYYYEPMSYPVYYPRTSKYEVYQAVLPYYYDRPLMRSNSGFGYYGYEDADPIVDIEEEMLHDAERKQREDSQPIGQETYFEDNSNTELNSNEDNYYGDVNAAFMNNLIMSNMYKDALDRVPNTPNGYFEDDEDNDEIYGKVDAYPPNNKPGYSKPSYYNEDEEVQELKNLAESKAKQLKPDDRWNWFQKGSNKKSNEFFDTDFNEKKRSVDGKLEWFTDRSDRKSSVAPTVMPSTPTEKSTTMSSLLGARKIQRGQKEEVLPRPAAPVKHPFTSPVVNNVFKKDRPRQPSVYDTIKHMLDMEKSLENENVVKPPMRKRIISSEDSLTHQLSVLKKND